MNTPKLKKFYSVVTTPMEMRWENAYHNAYLGFDLTGYVRIYSGINCSLEDKYLPLYSNGSKLNTWMLDLRLDAYP